MYAFAAHAEAPLLMRLVLLLSTLMRVATDCNFQAYYQDSNDNYPNSYYCTNRQDTWSGGTADVGGCVHWSNGLVKRCACTCFNEGPANGLRRCGNSYDGETSACYADTVQCDLCVAGTERRGCGCDGSTAYHACSAGSCKACANGKFSNGNTPCTACTTCGAGKYQYSPCIKGSAVAVGEVRLGLVASDAPC
jgi:hypothetical protein